MLFLSPINSIENKLISLEKNLSIVKFIPVMIGIAGILVLIFIYRFGCGLGIPLNMVYSIVKNSHSICYILLTVFLISGLLFHVNARRALKTNGYPEIETIANNYRHHYLSARYIAPVVALIILGSGLILIHLNNYSLSQGWLFGLIAFFTFGFIDGITNYTPYTEELKLLSSKAYNERIMRQELLTLMNSKFYQYLYCFHGFTLICSYYFGLSKIDFYNPVDNLILSIEKWSDSNFLSAFSKLLPPFIMIVVEAPLVYFGVKLTKNILCNSPATQKNGKEWDHTLISD